MSKDFIKPAATRRVPPALITVAWVVALGIPSLMLHNSRVQAVRREAEEQVLTEVAAAINCPVSTRPEIMALLAKQQSELSDTRYVRVCSRLGIPMDWHTIFQRIARSGKAEQDKAVQVIAQECHLGAGATLKQAKVALAWGLLKDSTAARTLPIAVPVSRSVD